MIRDGINVAREELAAARGADRRAGREELSGVKEALSKDGKDKPAARRHASGAAPRSAQLGRECAFRLGQTLHHLVERRSSMWSTR